VSASSPRNWLATTLTVAQVFAVAHLALVPHTSTSSGGVASIGFAIEEHVDTLAHQGPHAHQQAPAPKVGEEHCTVLALLSASSHGPQGGLRVVATAPSSEAAPATASAYAPTRRERLLSAPKASPPVSPLI
jgi:hypothetical protein